MEQAALIDEVKASACGRAPVSTGMSELCRATPSLLIFFATPTKASRAHSRTASWRDPHMLIDMAIACCALNCHLSHE
jgi:hypothetical protein